MRGIGHGCLLGTGACVTPPGAAPVPVSSTGTHGLRDLDGTARGSRSPSSRRVVTPSSQISVCPASRADSVPPAAVGLEQHDLVRLLEPQRVGPADRGVEDVRRAS